MTPAPRAPGAFLQTASHLPGGRPDAELQPCRFAGAQRRSGRWPFTPNAFIHMNAMGGSLLVMHYVEMGQAPTYNRHPDADSPEELEVRPQTVKLQHAARPQRKDIRQPGALGGIQATGNSNAISRSASMATLMRRGGGRCGRETMVV